MDIELVCEGLEFPEGPIAMADGSVILTEIKGRRLTRVTPDGKRETVVETGGGPNGAAIGPDGAIWITNNGGSFEWLDTQGLTIPGPTPASHTGGSLQRYDLATSALTTVYDSCEGRPLWGPNDLVFDKHGGVWFTDHGCSTPEGRKFGGVYYAKTDGTLISRQRDHIISPNGIGLSPDESVVYVADTNLGRLWAFDVAEPGARPRLRARPGDPQPAGLPAARQPGGGGRRQGLRGHHHQRRHHRLRPLGKHRTLRLPRHPLHQHLLRRRRYDGRLGDGLFHRQALQDPMAASWVEAQLQRLMSERAQAAAGPRGHAASRRAYDFATLAVHTP